MEAGPRTFTSRLGARVADGRRVLRGDWTGRSRGERAALAGLAMMLALAAILRLWLMLDYGPGFVGFGDTHEYITAAATGVFGGVQKPAGYPILLAFLHLLSDRIAFAVLVQHLLGLSTAVLLFAAVRRTGAPAWLGLLPAAVVLFGGTGVLLEHSLLADPLFAFLQALGLYAAVRALGARGPGWALAAGVAVGLCFWVKTVAIADIAAIALVLALTGSRPARRGLASAGAFSGAAVGLILLYVAIQGLVTGFWGLQRQDAWNLYGRVATFVDCAHFRPPAGTASLCPAEAPGHRLPPAFFQYGPSTPAVKRFGPPSRASTQANALLERFSVAAIEHEPVAYANAILRGLGFFVDPRAGEGYTPQTIREALLDPVGVRGVEPALRAYYPHDRGYLPPTAGTGSLDSFERHTRLQGLVLVLLVLGGLLGTPLLVGVPRSAGALFTSSALATAALAVAANSYDARYGYPAFAPLAAGAALGGWGIVTRLRGHPPVRRGGALRMPRRDGPRTPGAG